MLMAGLSQDLSAHSPYIRHYIYAALGIFFMQLQTPNLSFHNCLLIKLRCSKYHHFMIELHFFGALYFVAIFENLERNAWRKEFTFAVRADTARADKYEGIRLWWLNVSGLEISRFQRLLSAKILGRAGFDKYPLTVSWNRDDRVCFHWPCRFPLGPLQSFLFVLGCTGLQLKNDQGKWNKDTSQKMHRHISTTTKEDLCDPSLFLFKGVCFDKMHH